MRSLIHFIKKIVWFPADLIICALGGIPPSYWEDVKYEGECDADRFMRNDAECRRKYGMSMLEKIRAEEREVMGERYAEVEIGCARFFEPWYNIEVFHDMMCRTEGLFDDLLAEHLTLLKHEMEARDRDKAGKK
jgi:hypothetical protein